MRIIYGYSNCTDATYNRIISERNVAVMVPDQKYHGLLIKGLEKNGAEVFGFSGLPVSRAVTSRRLVREKDEREGNARFHYITTVNFPGIRQLMVAFGAFFGVLKLKKAPDTYAVCDILDFAVTLGVYWACKLKRIKTAGIVTDLPDMEFNGKLLRFFSNRLIKKSDALIMLTEQMNSRINPNGKPYIVLEGHVDSEAPLPEKQIPYETETGVRLVMYAGSLKKLYGIESLAKGFLQADIPNAELRIYGDGDYRPELEALAAKHPTVKYMGVAKNAEIVRQEQKASLLVNPRPTAPEYTKYSFPSKNMEYMASGTPLLTTKLPGMPKEYYPYIYLLEDETPEGAAKALRDILSAPLSQRRKKGSAAREFVLKNKSNLTQAKKILEFLPVLNKTETRKNK